MVLHLAASSLNPLADASAARAAASAARAEASEVASWRFRSDFWVSKRWVWEVNEAASERREMRVWEVDS